MGLLSKIYGIVQSGRYLFNIICGTFEQSEADRRVFRKFDDGEVGMVVFMHMDDILAHAQAIMERFAAELGGKVKNEVDGGEVWRREGKEDTSFFGGANPFSSELATNSGGGGRYVQVPV